MNYFRMTSKYRKIVDEYLFDFPLPANTALCLKHLQPYTRQTLCDGRWYTEEYDMTVLDSGDVIATKGDEEIKLQITKDSIIIKYLIINDEIYTSDDDDILLEQSGVADPEHVRELIADIFVASELGE